MKYIIELEKIEGTDLWRAKGAKTLVFDQYGIDHILDPYTEPTEHDGCKGCVHEYLGSELRPCRYCKEYYTDKYVAKPKKTIKRWEQYEGDFIKATKDHYEEVCQSGGSRSYKL